MKQESPAAEPPAKKAAAPARKPRAARPPPAMPGESREEAVRRMAYFLYVERGGVDGHEVEDWLRAEALVEADLAAAVAVAGTEPPPAAAKKAPAKRAAAKPAAAGTAAPAAVAKRAAAKTRAK